jgi:16S rRNA (guanine966-N2)-methyltransferase
MTRIVAGALGGRRLSVPASGTRPTSDRTREALFSALTAALGDFTGIRLLDLYAGSGAIGLEALSRGAASAVFVESAPAALAALRENVSILAGSGAEVVAGRVESVVATWSGSPFDVVFADPPYAMESVEVAANLAVLLERNLVLPEALVVVERGAREAWAWPVGLDAVRERRYGDAVLWYGRARRSNTEPIAPTEVG